MSDAIIIWGFIVLAFVCFLLYLMVDILRRRIEIQNMRLDLYVKEVAFLRQMVLREKKDS